MRDLSIPIILWIGFWQGIGLEISFLVLWVGWHFVYKKAEGRLHPEHWLHRIHDYFSS